MNSDKFIRGKTPYQSAEVLMFTAFMHNKKGLTLIFYLFTLFLFFYDSIKLNNLDLKYNFLEEKWQKMMVTDPSC